MAEPLKNLFTKEITADFGRRLERIQPSFQASAFTDRVFDTDWEGRELKERMRHISDSLAATLLLDFPDSIGDILQVVRELRQDSTTEFSFGHMFLPDYVEVYGLDHYELAVAAMEEVTQLISCEFAVRPYLRDFPEEMEAQMLSWSLHPNRQVRRLASEGFRPRLPWGMGIPRLKADPAPILPVLENLRQDPCEIVRRSVANNLNDISKDHPGLVLEIAGRWLGQHADTDKLVKHALRGLLKQGHPEALRLMGYGDADAIVVRHWRGEPMALRIGESWEFGFEIRLASPQRIRLEYAIDFVKARGQASRKVFQIAEGDYDAGTHVFRRKHSFQERTTRKHYPGAHRVTLVVNGVDRDHLVVDLRA